MNYSQKKKVRKSIPVYENKMNKKQREEAGT